MDSTTTWTVPATGHPVGRPTAHPVGLPDVLAEQTADVHVATASSPTGSRTRGRRADVVEVPTSVATTADEPCEIPDALVDGPAVGTVRTLRSCGTTVPGSARHPAP
ncbi:hypothetical protein WDZ17_06250 [Pseudokineococcus basanitobsidens]|uniref:Uncharacterized protein n=1 Tax=Pseudokineococcus basanitobsidens TaxID=1926649 RepID=A0ABU8RIP2_9ACTN